MNPDPPLVGLGQVVRTENFNACLHDFDRVQFSRQATSQYSKVQLRFDVVGNRLARCGRAVSLLEHSTAGDIGVSDWDMEYAEQGLQGILNVFAFAEKKAAKTAVLVEQESRDRGSRTVTGTYDLSEMNSVDRELCQHLRELRRGSTSRKSSIQRPLFIVHDEGTMNEMIKGLTRAITHFELCVKTDAKINHRLADEEVRGIYECRQLKSLLEATKELDTVLNDVAHKKYQSSIGRSTNHIKDTTVHGEAVLRAGAIVAGQNDMTMSPAMNPSNIMHGITVGEKATAGAGNVYYFWGSQPDGNVDEQKLRTMRIVTTELQKFGSHVTDSEN